MTEYIALIHKDPTSGYGVSFPDLPGVVTASDTMEDLRKEAEEALALHLEGMAEDGEAAPPPSPLDAIAGSEDYRDAVAVLVVAAPAAANPSVRVNITMPQTVLAEIDRYAEHHGLTRSGFLVRAARRELQGVD